MKVPLFRISSDKLDEELVGRVIARGENWAMGPEIEEFEQGIANYLGVKYAVTFNSGTSALHAAMLALGIGEGDEVIVPSFTFISTANAAMCVGAKPVFAEIEEETYGLDVGDVERRMTARTKAIVMVHYGGSPARDTSQIKELAKARGVFLVEDAAEAMGAKIGEQMVGTFGDLGVLSFCQNKIISTGEGGAVVTDSKEWYRKLKSIGSLGRVDNESYFSSTSGGEYTELGYNFRMSSVAAALGLSQLGKIEDNIRLRNFWAETYRQDLKGLNWRLPVNPRNGRHVYQLFSIRLPGKEREELKEYLTEKGIGVKVYFEPVHLTGYYKQKFGFEGGELPVTERLAKEVLTLPCFPSMKEEELDYVIGRVLEYANGASLTVHEQVMGEKYKVGQRMNGVMDYYREKKILVTGGAGSIGGGIVRALINGDVGVVRVYDNSEQGLFNINRDLDSEKVRVLHGDVRDKDRLKMAVEGIDMVFHAAAMKHVGVCEMNPFEAAKTNVLGTQNLIEVALEQGVKRVVGISTDKAVDPINVMGATKLLSERLLLSAERYRGDKETRFSCVRFGNVLMSSGSVIPIFVQQIAKGGPVTVTDTEMVRFVMGIPEAVELILKAGYLMRGQEIFILRMPRVRVMDLCEVLVTELAPVYGYKPEEIEIKVVGNQFREKLDEELMAVDEIPFVREEGGMLVVDRGSEMVGEKDGNQLLRMQEFRVLEKMELRDWLKRSGVIQTRGLKSGGLTDRELGG